LPAHVLWINVRDLRHLPLIRHKKRLARLIPKRTSTLSAVLAVEEDGRGLFEAVCGLELEGPVAKRKADPYTPRTQLWKIRN
jgi:ATP-dependent DNA ligase